ncbi:MAG: transporter substrate-binding domain-containing protein [Hyphomicrobiaceae bacterium]
MAQSAQTDTPANTPTPAEKLKVATKVAPPFAMQAEDGRWTGIAVELIESIARDLNRDIVWKRVETSEDLVAAVEKQSVDMGVAAVSITAAREAKVDFSYPYYDSGLSIAVVRNRSSGFWDIMKALGSPAFLTTVSMLGLLLLITGAVMWAMERKGNSQQFPKKPIEGIANGFWWSAVTMTTVGYGDKAPVTPLGRAIAVIWMFAALILTAVFTAQLTASLTLEGISGPVSGPRDLPNARVGIVAKSATADYFHQRFIGTRGFEDVAAGLKAVEVGSIDAFVHDEPILRYAALHNFAGRVQLLDQIFEPQSYGIVLPSRSPLREPVNRSLLTILESDRWSTIRRRYLGQRP